MSSVLNFFAMFTQGRQSVAEKTMNGRDASLYMRAAHDDDW